MKIDPSPFKCIKKSEEKDCSYKLNTIKFEEVENQVEQNSQKNVESSIEENSQMSEIHDKIITNFKNKRNFFTKV